MILLFAASLLISFAGGILLTFLLCPSLKSGGHGLAFRLFAGCGLGLGVSSCLFFVCLLTGLTRYGLAVDLGVCLLLGILWRVSARRPAAGTGLPPPETGKRSRLRIVVAGIFFAELTASAITFVLAFLKEPHGRWDAWLIWNMHARFLFRGGDHWRDAFASGLDWSHWDYPLLLPLAVARNWQYSGGEDLLGPAVTAFAFTFLTLGLLWSSLSLLRNRTQGTLAAMVLMGTPFFIALGASQFADLPMAFFILATLGWLFLHGRSEEGQPGAIILAGLAAGMCAWTKNEGLLFILVVTVALFGATVHAGGWRQAARRTGGFLAGALPVLMVVLYFKLRIAPANDLMAGFNLASLPEKLFDVNRYAQIARAFFITGISFTQGLIDVRVGMRLNPGAVSILLLIVYLPFAGVRIDPKDRAAVFQTAAILFLMLAGYFFVYVLTPQDLTWHLFTSLNRLFLQLWPAFILLFFMLARTPEEIPGPGRETGVIPAQTKSRPSTGGKHRKIKETK